jgi:hypothetical protein
LSRPLKKAGLSLHEDCFLAYLFLLVGNGFLFSCPEKERRSPGGREKKQIYYDHFDFYWRLFSRFT